MNIPALSDFGYDGPVNFWMAMSYFVNGALAPTIVRIQTYISNPFTNIGLFFAPSVKAIYPMAIIVMVALQKASVASVSVTMPASSALVAQRHETHVNKLQNGTSYPIMTLPRRRGLSTSELAEEESIEDNSAAKREIIEIA